MSRQQNKKMTLSARLHSQCNNKIAMNDPLDVQGAATGSQLDLEQKEVDGCQVRGRVRNREDGQWDGEEVSGREKLKRHRLDVAGRVGIPDTWVQEELLKEWIDCSAFDLSLVPRGISSARKSLIEECRSANSNALQIENRC